MTVTENQVDLIIQLLRFAPNIGGKQLYGADLYLIIDKLKGGRALDYPYLSKSKKEKAKNAIKKLVEETGKNGIFLAKFLEEKYLEPRQKEIKGIKTFLINSGYARWDPNTSQYVIAGKKHLEFFDEYRKIKALTSKQKYAEALKVYYEFLGNKFYGPLTDELVYLKRCAHVELSGRDILYYRKAANRTDLINEHLKEYVDCIDELLKNLKRFNRKTPLEILIEFTSTLEELLEKKNNKYKSSVSFTNGRFINNSFRLTKDDLNPESYHCHNGRLFDKYLNLFWHSRVYSYKEKIEFRGVWTLLSPENYEKMIIQKNIHLKMIEVYYPKAWRRVFPKIRQEPHFTTIESCADLERHDLGTSDIRYTGNSHQIEGNNFYEIELIRRNIDSKNYENPFENILNELLREAENLLRKRHGLPSIGEGWIAETQLYNLIFSYFPEAEHHASPDWLKPQHIDIFIPSKKLAIEYQGQQHFEPIDFFGGKSSFEDQCKRDKRKLEKCKKNKIELIYWKHDEAISTKNLIDKLKILSIEL